MTSIKKDATVRPSFVRVTDEELKTMPPHFIARYALRCNEVLAYADTQAVRIAELEAALADWMKGADIRALSMVAVATMKLNEKENELATLKAQAEALAKAVEKYLGPSVYSEMMENKRNMRQALTTFRTANPDKGDK